MRIQEVMGKTGLSRRTIHYYIDQKLIIPPVNDGKVTLRYQQNVA